MNKPKWKIREDLLLVISDKPQEMSKGGIVIPEQARGPGVLGTVIAAGNNIKSYKEGDRIIYSRFTGLEVIFDEVEYLFLEERNILATIEKGDD